MLASFFLPSPLSPVLTPQFTCHRVLPQGRVLATLVRSMDARRILDLGTFIGYSSIAMALVAADDAKISCCEPDSE